MTQWHVWKTGSKRPKKFDNEKDALIYLKKKNIKAFWESDRYWISEVTYESQTPKRTPKKAKN